MESFVIELIVTWFIFAFAEAYDIVIGWPDNGSLELEEDDELVEGELETPGIYR